MGRFTKKIVSIFMLAVFLSQVIYVPKEAKAVSTEGFLGEICIFAGGTLPYGWALCDGRLLNKSENEALFSIIGTKYGGDGVWKFALPNLNGRVPIGAGEGTGLSKRKVGEIGGKEKVALTIGEMPAHGHGNQEIKFSFLNINSSIKRTNLKGNTEVPAEKTILATGARNERLYSSNTTIDKVSMMKDAIQVNQEREISLDISGHLGGVEHNNMKPYMKMLYIICVKGLYPSQTSEAEIGLGGGEDVFTGEIKMFAGDYIPNGMIPCDGRSLPISKFNVLYSLIGKTYGGDSSNFNVPDLRGRAPVSMSQGYYGSSVYKLGQMGGSEKVSLTVDNMSNHNHNINQTQQKINITGSMQASENPGNSAVPEGCVLAVGRRGERIYSTSTQSVTSGADSISYDFKTREEDRSLQVSSIGGGLPHENMMPYMPIGYFICANGLYPQEGDGSSNVGDDRYIGSIEMYAFNFVPAGAALCNGQRLSTQQNSALNSLIGTTYGGDGSSWFSLPDLQGRVVIGGKVDELGKTGGEEKHSLLINETPTHNHLATKKILINGNGNINGTNATGNSIDGVNSIFSWGFKNERVYSTTANKTITNAVDIGFDLQITPVDTNGNQVSYLTPEGLSIPHENMMPYTTINFAIVTGGLMPSSD